MRANTVLAALAAAATVASSSADVVDLGGSTLSVSSLAEAQYGGVSFAGNTVVNGVLNTTDHQIFSDAVYTFGSGLTLNQNSDRWTVSGGRQVHVVDGGVINLNNKELISYFGRCWSDGSWISWGGQTKLVLDHGTFNCAASLYFSPIANVDASNKRTIELFLQMANGSSLSSAADVKFGETQSADGKKFKAEKVSVEVADSTISAGRIYFGGYYSNMSSPGDGYVNATFGSGSDITCQQFYVY